MAIISEKYIKKLLDDYIKSDVGREKIRQYKWDVFHGKKEGGRGMLTKDDMYQYMFEIEQMFFEAVCEVIPSFRNSYESVHAEADTFGDEGVYVHISVDEEALHRSSLHYMREDKDAEPGNRLSIGHGEGVYDIIGLFTHGYTISGKRPYGFWVRDGLNGQEPLKRIGALMHRDPNPFLKVLVDEINREYRGICTATLDERYRR